MGKLKDTLTRFANISVKPYVKNQLAKLRTDVITNPTAFSIETSTWSALTSAIGGYQYGATLSISNITANDSIDVIFDINSIDICIDANVAPSVTVNNGSVIIYSTTVPTATVSGCYIIIKNQST